MREEDELVNGWHPSEVHGDIHSLPPKHEVVSDDISIDLSGIMHNDEVKFTYKHGQPFEIQITRKGETQRVMIEVKPSKSAVPVPANRQVSQEVADKAQREIEKDGKMSSETFNQMFLEQKKDEE